MPEAEDRLGLWTLELECEEEQRWGMRTLKLKRDGGGRCEECRHCKNYSEKKREAGDVDRALFFSP